ncbi:hypothetical protein [Agriterribacter sp.]|uniref:hypothetical protein n=1 Tax=Agriterribacter sp. TaxID=2821509 RepID=UPI002BB78B5B|nr:hypothetical protein [Agriterribacter sp.]HRP56070.1 hypothetical protein [Agriterribacter sp.]
MSFANNPEALQATPSNIVYTRHHLFSSSFHEYEDQVMAYFTDRSSNTAFQCDTEKLKKRFEAACKQVERFILLQKEQ